MIDKKTKWSYCVGATGRDAAYVLVSMFVLTYIQYTMKLEVIQFTVISATMVICMIWDAVNDLIMSSIIENSHFRAGKYRPFIIVGAVLNAEFVEAEKKVEKSLVNPTYMFGTVHERDDKFTFPEGTPEAIVKFCQKPVDEFYDPKPLWEIFQQHPEIEEISDQIWNEVKCCAEYGELYHVW